MYLPEIDGGKRLSSLYPGEAVSSAFMWLPSEKIPNKDALIQASNVVYVNGRTGESTSIALAKEVGDYVIVAKHLFPDWESKLGKVVEPDLGFSEAGFVDTISPRDDAQRAAWEAFSSAGNGVLNLACGKGKTVLALKKVAQRNHPAIVIVNNTGLLDQWVDRAQEFLGLGKSDIGIVQQKRREWDKPLVIAMIHTLARLADQEDGIPQGVRQRYGTVIFDEVHHLSASTFIKTAAVFYGSRFGLTATATREDGLEKVYYAHVGEIFHSDLQGDLVSDVFFAELKTSVNMRSKEVTDVRGEFCVSKFYTHIAENKQRNLHIIKHVGKALRKDRKIIVLCHSVKHPENLRDLGKLSQDFKGKKMGCVTGATKGPDRVKIIRECDVTFATFNVAKEGLDVAQLDTVFFVTPFKAWGSLQQGKGRVERQHPGKKDPLVVIFDDVRIPPATAMCRSLKRSLKSNGFTFRVFQ